MCNLSSIALLALLLPLAGKAQQTSQPASVNDGLSCFENLAAPEYPRAALDAHVDGSVWTWTTVSSQGAIEKVETDCFRMEPGTQDADAAGGKSDSRGEGQARVRGEEGKGRFPLRSARRSCAKPSGNDAY